MGPNFTNYFWNRDRRHCRGDFLDVSVVVVVLMMYTANTFYWKPNCDSAFVHGYLNDLLAMPLIVAYTNVLIRWVGRCSAPLVTPLAIGGLTAFCVVVWEGLTPLLLPTSTADLIDVIAYCLGSCFYYLAVRLGR